MAPVGPIAPRTPSKPRGPTSPFGPTPKKVGANPETETKNQKPKTLRSGYSLRPALAGLAFDALNTFVALGTLCAWLAVVAC